VTGIRTEGEDMDAYVCARVGVRACVCVCVTERNDYMCRGDSLIAEQTTSTIHKTIAYNNFCSPSRSPHIRIHMHV